MRNCETYWELMSCALDGALTEEEKLRLEGHLSQCPDCRELFAQMQQLQSDVPGLEEAPAGFVDEVMEQTALTEQEIPFTNLPQNRDIHKGGRDSLKAWWKPIVQWCAIAACFLIVCGVGTMAKDSGLFASGGTSAPAATPNTEGYAQESESIAPGDEVKDDSGYSMEDSAHAVAEDIDLLEWEGVSYTYTGETVQDLPEGLIYAGEVSLTRADEEVRSVYTGADGALYVDNGTNYERWEKIEE